MKFIFGRKIEMTQQFADDGTVVPVTLVKTLPCVVTQVRTEENDGYVAVQIGSEEKRKLNKPESGHVNELGLFGVLREFRVGQTDLKRGDKIEAGVFKSGDMVNIVGTSKGRGFAGVVKRHGFHGSPASHGHKDQLRMPGSIGSKRQGPVAKGKRMPGHMGNQRITVKNLQIISVDSLNHVIAIKGAIPGARGGLVLIRSKEGENVWQS